MTYYLSKGQCLGLTNNAIHVNALSGRFSLTNKLKEYWVDGMTPKPRPASIELDFLQDNGLMISCEADDLGLAGYKLLGQVILNAIHSVKDVHISSRAEQIYAWVENTNLMVDELIRITELGVIPGPRWYGERHLQEIGELLYEHHSIMDGWLTKKMEKSWRRNEVIRAIFELANAGMVCFL